MELEVKKAEQGPVLAAKGDVGAGCTAGYCGPTYGTGPNSQVGGGYNPTTGATGGGYSCSN